jgi:hypothetical protein
MADMPSTDDTLAAIDAAVDDWEADAMRWYPDGPNEPGPDERDEAEALYTLINEYLSRELAPHARRLESSLYSWHSTGTAPPPPAPPVTVLSGVVPQYTIVDELHMWPDPDRLREAFAPLGDVMENAQRAFEGFGRAYFNGWIAPSAYVLRGGPKRRSQAVNAAYARRRRARARRRR